MPFTQAENVSRNRPRISMQNGEIGVELRESEARHYDTCNH